MTERREKFVPECGCKSSERAPTGRREPVVG